MNDKARQYRNYRMYSEQEVAPAARNSPSYIRWIQRSLNAILGARLLVDGHMGPKTRLAIRSFQQRQGLAVDGIVGPKTEGALVAAYKNLILGE